MNISLVLKFSWHFTQPYRHLLHRIKTTFFNQLKKNKNQNLANGVWKHNSLGKFFNEMIFKSLSKSHCYIFMILVVKTVLLTGRWQGNICCFFRNSESCTVDAAGITEWWGDEPWAWGWGSCLLLCSHWWNHIVLVE